MLRKILIASTAAALVLAGALTRPALADGPPPETWDTSATQAEFDAGAGSSGGWDDAQRGGTTPARPVVTDLTVGTTSVISAGVRNPSVPLDAVVFAANVCPLGTPPAPGVCYAEPNRAGVTLVYTPVGDPELHTGLDTPAAQGALDHASLPPITDSTVIDITIDLNGYGDSLGWTWLNGGPTFWQVSGTGADRTIHAKFTPAQMPYGGLQQNGTPDETWYLCSRIPVEGCSAVRPEGNALTATMVMSFDDTVRQFAGAMFASKGAYIAALNSSGGNLAYGIAAPHLASPDPAENAPRTGDFYGFVPQSILEDLVQQADGYTSGATINADLVASLLEVTRTEEGEDSPTVASASWTRWTNAVEGSDGWLVTIAGIGFSAPTYCVASKGGSCSDGGGGGGGEGPSIPVTINGTTATFDLGEIVGADESQRGPAMWLDFGDGASYGTAENPIEFDDPALDATPSHEYATSGPKVAWLYLSADPSSPFEIAFTIPELPTSSSEPKTVPPSGAAPLSASPGVAATAPAAAPTSLPLGTVAAVLLQPGVGGIVRAPEAAARTLGRAPEIAVPLGRASRVRLVDLPASRSLPVSVRINGTWQTLPPVTTSRTGVGILLPLSFTVAGSYPLRITLPSGAVRFAVLDVS